MKYLLFLACTFLFFVCIRAQQPPYFMRLVSYSDTCDTSNAYLAGYEFYQLGVCVNNLYGESSKAVISSQNASIAFFIGYNTSNCAENSVYDNETFIINFCNPSIPGAVTNFANLTNAATPVYPTSVNASVTSAYPSCAETSGAPLAREILLGTCEVSSDGKSSGASWCNSTHLFAVNFETSPNCSGNSYTISEVQAIGCINGTVYECTSTSGANMSVSALFCVLAAFSVLLL